MPIYQYACPKCSEEIELFRPMNAEAPSCQKCGTELEKQISAHAGYSIKGNNSASQRPRGAGSFKGKGSK